MQLICHEIRMMFEDYIKDELRHSDRKHFRHHLDQCEDCQNEFEKEQKVIHCLTNLPQFQCPERVNRAVLEETIFQEKRKFYSSIKNLETIFNWRIASISFAVLGIIALLVFSPFKEENTIPVQTNYSMEEIQKARQQVKWSLTYTAQKLQKTENKAIEEVIIQNIPKTIRDAIKSTVPIF